MLPESKQEEENQQFTNNYIALMNSLLHHLKGFEGKM